MSLYGCSDVTYRGKVTRLQGVNDVWAGREAISRESAAGVSLISSGRCWYLRRACLKSAAFAAYLFYMKITLFYLYLYCHTSAHDLTVNWRVLVTFQEDRLDVATYITSQGVCPPVSSRSVLFNCILQIVSKCLWEYSCTLIPQMTAVFEVIRMVMI